MFFPAGLGLAWLLGQPPTTTIAPCVVARVWERELAATATEGPPGVLRCREGAMVVSVSEGPVGVSVSGDCHG